MKRFAGAIFGIASLLLVSVPSAHATLYMGSLVYPGDILASGAWANTGTSFAWNVDDFTNSGYWTYAYTFTTPTAAGAPSREISHFLLEVSDSFTMANLISSTPTLTGDGDGLDEWGDQGGSNPGIPSTMWGLKFNELDGYVFNFSLVSDRLPTCGDFYAVDGKQPGNTAYAYNAGYDSDPAGGDPINCVNLNKVVVPDTGTPPPPPPGQIPEPMSLLLLGSGLAGVVGFSRKKKL